MHSNDVNSPAAFLLVAVHKGPYLSIEPLEEELGTDRVLYLVEGVSKEYRAQKGLPFLDLTEIESRWGSLEDFLYQTGVKAVIRSSSEDVLERNAEELCSEAATKLSVPVFVIEDFPGNYWHNSSSRLDGLFVEDEPLRGLHEARGVDPEVIYNRGNPRYNVLSTLDKGARGKETRRALGLRDERVVVWAGQPDGDNSFLALERLFSGFGDWRVSLLFRAHPRDRAYAAGGYEKLLASTPMKVLDVSTFEDTIGLYCASDLVVTQFSSAGVEAGYLGVPAVFVLFDDLGKEYLRLFKGYDMPPWCVNGCTFVIEEEEEVKDVLDRAVFDASAREEVLTSFQNRFVARADGARTIADRIRSVSGEIA